MCLVIKSKNNVLNLIFFLLIFFKVILFFYGKFYRGNRVLKVDVRRFGVFDFLNCFLLVIVEVGIEGIMKMG